MMSIRELETLASDLEEGKPMQRNSTAKGKGGRRRHSASIYRTISELGSLDASGGNAENAAPLYALLGLWALFMLEIDPAAAAPRVYRALVDAWAERRASLPNDGVDEEIDKLTCMYHGALHEALKAVQGKAPRELWPFEPPRRAEHLRAAARLTALVAARLNEWQAIYLPGAPGSPVADKDGLLDADETARLTDELRAKLDHLTDITDESERFRIERQIYDLNGRAPDSEEWREYIDEGEGDD